MAQQILKGKKQIK